MTEAELLFCQILNCNRPSLYLNKNAVLDKDNSILASSVLKRRILGEPLPYILGKTEFMGLDFKVTPDVLIPRQETEIVVETALKQISGLRPQVSAVNILDIGTGSGNIAVSLAKHLPDAKIYACDVSARALDIAKANAMINKVEDSIVFIQSDLFASYDLRSKTYDLIISNPPYVATTEIDNLQAEIQYEPRTALDGGRDGLDFYRRIINEAPRFLTNKGLLILEMGFNQADSVENIFKISGKFEIIEAVKDYNDIDRVIVAKRMSKNG